MRVWALYCFHSLINEYPNLSVGADCVGGQLHGVTERVPLQWQSSSVDSCTESLKECPSVAEFVGGQLHGVTERVPLQWQSLEEGAESDARCVLALNS